MRLAVTTPFRPTPAALAAAREAAVRRALPFQPRATRSLAEVAAAAGVEALLVLGGHVSLWVDGAEQRWHPGMGGLRAKRLLQGERVTGDSFLEAARLRPGDAVLDCTLGLGADALVAAAAVGPGGRVVGLESSPLLAAWAGEGFARLPGEAAARVEVIAADHAAWLAEAPGSQLRRGGLRPHVPARPPRRARGSTSCDAWATPGPSPATRSTGHAGWRGAACWSRTARPAGTWPGSVSRPWTASAAPSGSTPGWTRVAL